ncbi:protein SIEVE ELEMENT OCCLUSION B-like [Fagus crenata]
MIIKDSIRLVSFQNKNDNVLKCFWTKIKNLLISRTHRKTKIDSMMLELQKLISYKKKKEWVVVFDGSSIITIGGTSILTVFQEFGKWNDRLEEKFESVFKDHHNKVEPNDHGMCHYMKVPYNTGKIPKIMYCSSSNCNCIMETSITY